MLRVCSTCVKEQPITNYQLRKDSGKRRPNCNECRDKALKKYLQERKDGRVKVVLQNLAKEGKKTCTRCNFEKTVDLFRKRTDSKDGYANECLECCNERLRAYKAARRLNDPQFKVAELARSRLGMALKDGKTQNTAKYLKCTSEFLVRWLEYGMEDWMNWENHGTGWQIDHVIPIHKFNLLEDRDIDLCFGWYNLSPLSTPDNLSKRGIDMDQLERHIKTLKLFIEENNLDADEYQVAEEIQQWAVSYTQRMVKSSSDEDSV